MKAIRNVMMGLMLLILATSATNSPSKNGADQRSVVYKYGIHYAAKAFGLNHVLDPNKFYVIFHYRELSPGSGNYDFVVTCAKPSLGGLPSVNAPVSINVSGNATVNFGSGNTTVYSSGTIAAGTQSYTAYSNIHLIATPTVSLTSHSPTVVPSGTYAGQLIESLPFPPPPGGY